MHHGSAGTTVFGLARAATVFLVLGGAIGCADETPPTNVAPTRVLVIDDNDELPVPGIKVLVMDVTSNRPVAGPVTSDANGLCDFGVLTTFPLQLIAFCGGKYAVRSQEDWIRWRVPGLPTVSEPALPTGPIVQPLTSPAPPPVRIRVARRIQPGTPPSLAGIVVDADTRAPLNQVFLSLSAYASGYQGKVETSDDVTGADGAFLVYDIPLVQDEFGGPVLQLAPLRVTRYGYRPVLYNYSSRYGDTNLEIDGVIIPLTRLQPEDTGVLRGRVLRNGVPVAGLPVGLGVARIGSGKIGPGLVGWSARTDALGEWRIADLPPGSYVVHPGFLMFDGGFFPSQPANHPYAVESDAESVTEDFVVFAEIVPWMGRDARYGTAADHVLLTWSPIADAASYIVSIDGDDLPAVAGNAIDLTDPTLLAPGSHYWRVLALAADGQTPLGVTQVPAWYRIVE